MPAGPPAIAPIPMPRPTAAPPRPPNIDAAAPPMFARFIREDAIALAFFAFVFRSNL
ncbi:MAG: hypothetical protein ACO22U_08460 [bacterium]